MRRCTATLLCLAGVSLVITACGSSSNSGGGTSTTASASSCTPKHPGLKTIHPGALTVAVYEYLPYSTYKGGKLGGAEGEIAQRLAADECLKVKVLYGQAAGAIPAVTSGRADTTIGSWYRTAERAKIVLLGAPEVRDQMAIVSHAPGIKTIQDLKGKKVGAVTGYLWVEDLQKLLGSDLKLYPSTDASYQDLTNGRIDAAIDGATSVPLELKKTGIKNAVMNIPPPDPAVKASTAPGQPQMPVNKNNPNLRAALDDDLAALRASGQLKTIIVKNGFPASAANPGKPDLL